MWHSDYPGHLLLRLIEQTPTLVFHNSQQFDKHAHKLISVHKWLQKIPSTTCEVSVHKSATLGTLEILRYSQTPRPLVEDSSLGNILYIYYTYFLCCEKKQYYTHTLYRYCFRLLLCSRFSLWSPLAVSRLGDITLSLSSLEQLYITSTLYPPLPFTPPPVCVCCQSGFQLCSGCQVRISSTKLL